MAEVKRIDCSDCRFCSEGVFSGLDPALLPEIERHKSVLQFQRGQTICAEGMPPWAVYCIREGSVKIYRTGDRGEIQILRLRMPGDVIGLRSMAASEPFTCSADAIEKTVVCVLPRDFFVSLMRRSSELAAAVMSRLARNQRRTEDLMMALSQRSARRRLAQLLLYLEDFNNGARDGDQSRGIRLKRMEMAQMIGVSSETLSRIMRGFAEQGLVAADRREIELLDQDALRSVATRGARPS